MINKQQIKDEIDKIDEGDLIVIHRIIQALAKSPSIEPSERPEQKAEWIRFVKKMYGCLSDDPIMRGKQGEF